MRTYHAHNDQQSTMLGEAEIRDSNEHLYGEA